MKTKKVLAGLMVASAMMLAGCSLGGPKDLKKVEDQKTFIKDAKAAIEKEKGYLVEGKISGKDFAEITGSTEDLNASVKASADGKEFSAEFKNAKNEMVFGMINKANVLYFYMQGQWYKMGASTADELKDMTENFSIAEDLVKDDAAWDKGDIKYIGIEKVDGKKMYKFEIKDTEGDTANYYFNTDTKLVSRFEYTTGNDKGFVVTVKYGAQTIDAPANAQDFNIFGDGNETN